MPKAPSWLTSQDSSFWPGLSRVGSIFGIITPIGAVITWIATGTFTAPAIIVAIYLCALVTVLIVLLIRQERRYLREARYAAAMLPMRRAFSELANASWNLYQGDQSEQAFRLGLREALRRLAEAFTIITGTQCRACIKVVQAPVSTVAAKHDLIVSTLCRDNEQGDPPTHTPDRIGDNTDFKQIFTENKACFFSNDLLAQLSHGYRNSHWLEVDIDSGDLDYRATIVWPIERGATLPQSQTEPREIVGFLCVDTKTTGVFQQTYDDALGAGFAQALYLALARFRDLTAFTGTLKTQSANGEQEKHG